MVAQTSARVRPRRARIWASIGPQLGWYCDRAGVRGRILRGGPNLPCTAKSSSVPSPSAGGTESLLDPSARRPNPARFLGDHTSGLWATSHDHRLGRNPAKMWSEAIPHCRSNSIPFFIGTPKCGQNPYTPKYALTHAQVGRSQPATIHQLVETTRMWSSPHFSAESLGRKSTKWASPPNIGRNRSHVFENNPAFGRLAPPRC